AWMRTIRARGNATADVGVTADARTTSPFISRDNRSGGTTLPSMRISDSRVTVALLSRFLRLNRTPSSTFSRLPRVYICLRMRAGIFMPMVLAPERFEPAEHIADCGKKERDPPAEDL